jgi:hypothetical protein
VPAGRGFLLSTLAPEAFMSRPPIKFRGGRLPAQPGRPHLKLGAYLDHDRLPAAPASADWVSKVPASAWGILGNQEWGDCTCAGVAHKRIGDVYANRDEILPVTTTETLALYSAITGFNPNAGPSGDNPTDQGASCQSVLEFWHANGFLGEKIVAFAKVDLSNLAEVKQAIAIFGQLYCGLQVPQSAENQTNAGESWTVVPGSPNLGGHCMTIGAYDANGPSGITWGQLQEMTWEFFTAQFDECWVLVTPDFIAANGTDVQGLSLYQLGADWSALTGHPNPVPEPGVAPHHRSLADEMRAWLEAMGL